MARLPDLQAGKHRQAYILALIAALGMPGTAAAGPNAYVPNPSGTGTVSYFDTAVDPATVPVFTIPGFGSEPTRTAARPGSSEVWVSIHQDKTVRVIDSTINQVDPPDAASTNGQASGIAFNPCGDWAYVLSAATPWTGTHGWLHVIQASTRVQLTEYHSDMGKSPMSVVVSPECQNQRVYVSHGGGPGDAKAQQISVFGVVGGSLQFLGDLAASSERLTQALDLSPDGQTLYVGTWGGKYRVIDTGTLGVIADVQVCSTSCPESCAALDPDPGRCPQNPVTDPLTDLETSADGSVLFVSCGYTKQIHAFDTSTNLPRTGAPAVSGVLSTEACDCGQGDLSGCLLLATLHPDGTRLYQGIGNSGDTGDVAVVDVTSLSSTLVALGGHGSGEVAFGGLCGNESTDPGEDCDLGGLNGAPGVCCTIDCHYRAAGEICRTAAGECDVAETCNGASESCPSDGFAANGTPCTDDTNVCTVDQCDGSGNCAHPAGNAGTQCRASTGECDVAEVCDGLTTTCPPDGFAAPGVPCTSDQNVCTLDQCDGSGNCAHPAGNAGTQCRASDGECDVAEVCDGLTTTCPPDGFAPPGVPCTSDQNVCTLDQCDGSGNCAHPAGNAGTVCRPASDQCDLAETCTGASATCPGDQCQPNGTSCDDNDDCTTGETCQACDCGWVTPIECGPCETCIPTGGCVVAPRDGCKRVTPMTTRTFKSQLKLKDNVVDTLDRLDWRWKKGDRTTLLELGNPTTETGYTFCIFDESGAEPPKSMSAKVEPDGTCSGKPCWKLLGSLGSRGYQFRDSSGAQDGITKIGLKPGEEGKPRAQVVGRGSYLDMPTLPLSLPVRVQLQAEGAACWEATCESDGVSRNDASQFSAHCE